MIIPCKKCISFAMCIHRDEVSCSIIFEKAINLIKEKNGATNYTLKDGSIGFLFCVAHYLGHTDWTVYTLKKRVRIYTPEEAS